MGVQNCVEHAFAEVQRCLLQRYLCTSGDGLMLIKTRAVENPYRRRSLSSGMLPALGLLLWAHPG